MTATVFIASVDRIRSQRPGIAPGAVFLNLTPREQDFWTALRLPVVWLGSGTGLLRRRIEHRLKLLKAE